jgi:hypothetical protein
MTRVIESVERPVRGGQVEWTLVLGLRLNDRGDTMRSLFAFAHANGINRQSKPGLARETLIFTAPAEQIAGLKQLASSKLEREL